MKERVKGYMGKPQRLLRVLWECMFMEKSKDVSTYYTLHGWEDNYGNTILETILRELMRNCLNFIDDETILQTNDYKIGELRYHILVNQTLKFHPDLSSEFIEYSWGCANNYYKKILLDKNKGKKISKIMSKGPYQKTNWPQSGFEGAPTGVDRDVSDAGGRKREANGREKRRQKRHVAQGCRGGEGSVEQVKGNKTASAGMGGGGRREWTSVQVDRRYKTRKEEGELGLWREVHLSIRVADPGGVQGHGGWRENIQIKVGKGGAGLVKT